MPEPTDDDIIITIADYIRGQRAPEVTVEYQALEVNYELPEGSVAKHLDTAAEDAGYEVARRGALRASLRKKSGLSFA